MVVTLCTVWQSFRINDLVVVYNTSEGDSGQPFDPDNDWQNGAPFASNVNGNSNGNGNGIDNGNDNTHTETIRTTKLPESLSSLSSSSSSVSIPPSKMEIHYWEMWNHTTSTINVPEKYKNPFGHLLGKNSNINSNSSSNKVRRPLTSLEILEKILHGSEYKAEFEAVEAYIEDGNNNNSALAPSCLLPDVEATKELAKKVVSQRRQQQSGARNGNGNSNGNLVLPLPILNVGYPKVGSNTLLEYFDCIGMRASHGQNGVLMFENLSNGENLYKLPPNQRQIPMQHVYTQLDRNDGMGYYPQVSLLDEFHELHHDSTFVFNFRPISEWIVSVKKWGAMKSRFSRFLVPGLVLTDEQLADNTANAAANVLHNRSSGATNNSNNKTKQQQRRSPIGLSDSQLAKWWCGHVLHLREYVKEYPGHALIELDLYDFNGTADILHDLFQADTDAYWSALQQQQQQQQQDEAGEQSATANDETPLLPTKQQQQQQQQQQQCWGHGNKSSEREQQQEKRREKRRQHREKTYIDPHLVVAPPQPQSMMER